MSGHHTSGGSRNSQNSSNGNKGNPKPSNFQSPTSYQSTENRAHQGQGGSRPQNQRSEGSSRDSTQLHRGQPTTYTRLQDQRGTTQRPQYEGSNRGGPQGGFIDRKGKITRTDEKPPHLKPMQTNSTSGQLWKSFPDQREKIEIPIKPGEAKEFERKISLRVNYFPLQIKLPDNIYHYVVDINEVDENKAAKKPAKSNTSSQSTDKKPDEKKVLPKHLRCAIHEKLVDQLREAFLNSNPGKTIGIISDRSNALYSTKTLDLNVNWEQTVEISLDDDARLQRFRVVVAPTVEKVDTKRLQKFIANTKGIPITPDLQILDRVYNTLMKNLNCSRYVPIGRSSLICFEDRTSFRLGEGLLNFQGYNATIEIMNGWKPFINIHVANCATLLNKNVIEVFSDLFNLSSRDCRTTKGWREQDFKSASNLLSSCKVKYFPFGNDSKVLGGTVTKVIPLSISMKKFSRSDSDGKEREISVYDYYVERYGRTDLAKDGPCLELNSRNYVPAEICEVKKGQSINRKLSGRQTTAMIKCSKKPPNIVQNEIEQSISNLNLQHDPILKEFGCSFNDGVKLLELSQTRKLADPLLCYSGAKVTPANGVWDSYALKAKFLDAAKITKWGLLYTCKGKNGYDLLRSQSEFVSKLVNGANVTGVRIDTQPITQDLSKQLREREDAAAQNVKVLADCFAKHFKECEIVLVVLPHKPCQLYHHVKQAAEIKTGNLTQCVAADNFNPQSNRINSIVENILLKVNGKMGGINHTVVNPPGAIRFALFEEPVLIVGADVTHGGCDGGNSYAAVTCSMNTSGMSYMMHVQAQQRAGKGSAEVIQNFDVIMKKSLQAYRVHTRCAEYPTGLAPRKIIYCRDGVGEGQFPELLHTEMRSMRAACTSLSKTYQPAITFLTVQKRHKTRFFMQKNGKLTEENAPPGTIVDTDIVHPTENNFYLLSHQGIKGSTVRPTRYHVLWDDSGFSADHIQQLTYYLCYMYVRCNRSVSIPAPTYYAHHAASRASVLAQGHNGTIEEINEMLLRKKINEKSPMHFI